MPNSNFYNDDSQPEDEESTKIRIGDTEYDPKEVEELVSLGKIGKEAEEKYSNKLDTIWPDYTRKTQELKELQGKLADLEAQNIKTKEAAGQQLTPDEIKNRIQAEARQYGLPTAEDVRQIMREEFQAQELLGVTNGIVDELADMGVNTDSVTILDYMQNNDFKNPQRAAEEMYGEKIDQYRRNELASGKPEGLYTGDTSSAGATRDPNYKPISTQDELQAAITAAMAGE